MIYKFDLDLVHGYTKKPYNFRRDIKTSEELENEYSKLFDEWGIKPTKVIEPRQTHTDNIVCIDENDLNDEFLDTDGSITNLENVLLVTREADCIGILLYDRKNKVIGNIHSGWKGTLKRIGSKAIDIMINKYNCNPSDIEVYITPSIQKCCFEVDSDVYDLYKEEFKDMDFSKYVEYKNNKYYIDTQSINEELFKNKGIKKVIKSDICTKCNNEFYSYRRDKDSCGRNISFIML